MNRSVKLNIFDVGHGACALLTGLNDERVLIDCATNAKTGWSPGEYLSEMGVDKVDVLALTNYDEDHLRGLSSVLDNVRVVQIRRNRSVSPDLIKALKSEKGIGAGTRHLVRELRSRSFLGDIWFGAHMPGIEINQFWNRYPRFTDTNNLSMVVHLKCQGIGIMFPGDLEEEGWLQLLKSPMFKQALAETDLFIAPHHGRDSGTCEAVFEYCRPQYVVISDKAHAHDTQKTVDFYAEFARGGVFRGERRRVLTTRNDGTLKFDLYRDVTAGRRVPIWI